MSAARTAGEIAASPVERFFQLSLLGLLACGYLAIAGSGYLSNAIVALTAAPLAFRFLIVSGLLRAELPERWVTAVTLAYVGFYPLDYLFVSNDFLQASVHLVLFLAAIRLVTAKTDRDYSSLIAIALLELAAAAILSLNLSFFIFLGLFLWFAVSTFVSWEIRRSLRSEALVSRGAARSLNRRLASAGALVTLGILLLTSGMFFVLPRTAHAAFQRLIPERYRITAFSNEVTLGEIGEIKRNSRVMMHVRVDGVDGQVRLKWRGAALGRFDGKRWFNPITPGRILNFGSQQVALADDNQLRRKGRRVNYEVQLHPFGADVMFIGGRPEFLKTNLRSLRRMPWDSFQLSYAPMDTLQYGVYSFLEDQHSESPQVPPLLVPEDAKEYLALPPLDRRIPELSARVTLGYASLADKAAALEHHLQTQYAYTIELPQTEPPDALAYFLFERRAGHCEYFASAMAVMLRAIGIPSRVATGFQSGTYNPISGWHVIRASDAHSWVEAFIPGRGWMTYDPTPPDLSPENPSLWSRIALVIDAAETFWQNWVVNYDQNRQLSLAARMDELRRRFVADRRLGIGETWEQWKAGVGEWYRRYGRSIAIAFAFLAGLLPIAAILRPWLRRRLRARRVLQGEVRTDDATGLYLHALDVLKRAGFDRAPSLTPLEFAHGLPAQAPRAIVSELTAAYNDLRFGGRRDAASRIVTLLEQLEQSVRR
ncbi:MAG: DUF3488 domain-containing protein [Bryobacteraceae bacterium]|nr:DUF3488 domain-containing protein [Bryobacteraceae bacterium]